MLKSALEEDLAKLQNVELFNLDVTNRVELATLVAQITKKKHIDAVLTMRIMV
ncbi:hypothetical protein ACJVDH_06140 [Pedobacter sp. AW1-32]|uniref:hypothetical protein n=1 Tax=Pedobacter sp. AW1-32 TaxID=3383026 RepID=UPI003FF073C2